MNKVYHTSKLIPDHLKPYFDNDFLVPEDKDFYKLTSPIERIAVRIFADKAIVSNSKNGFFTTRSSVVILTTKTDIIKVNLHLFPVMRIKRPLPPVELHIKDSQGRKIPLNLPDTQLRQLSRYLSEGKPHLKFTCGEFRNFMYGFPEFYGIYNFHRIPFESHTICPGDGIILFGKNNEFLHSAIYIGNNLYLWHCGPTSLEVSFFNEMMNLYTASKAEILRPRQTQKPISLDIHSADSRLDGYLLPYYTNKLFMPAEVDLYRGIAPITDLEIEIDSTNIVDCRGPDSGTEFKVFQAAVVFTTANEIVKVGLHLFPAMRLKRRLPDARLSVVDDSGKKKSLVIAQPILKNLAKYFDEGKPNLEFFCFQFVNYLYGIPLKPTEPPFNPSPFDPAEITPGDAILLSKHEKNVHMAMYIGEGLYIWHAGPCCIRISNLDGMKDCYQPTTLQIARPKNSSS